ncbi:DUF3857 domain-containing protein [Marinobacter halodurans]|uniref:DUF3857 domain-containing protein n=1 Tax=Marinobacter halodurans TaxID=2528979 RepID=A0ABY1ZQB0_9GAMM|nr:DUF3857 domain-containing protein [Marinobacter halodurans]TBW57953.1 DUF3857 domain-containing protein [Marinobacter halodurans]
MNPRSRLQDASAFPLTLLLVLILGLSASTAGAAEVPTGPVPDWVTPIDIPVVESDGHEGSGSTDVLLFDEQLNLTGDTPRQFFHLANHIRNAEGLQDNSSLSVTYDPDYESIVIHRIRIHRDGRVIDRLPTADFQIYQRESNLERQLYNGNLTAHTVLDDLRVGDTVEYSYSVIGNNPVFDGRYSAFLPLQWSVSLARHSLRILVPETQPLTLQARPGRADFEQTRQDGIIEYRRQRDNVPGQNVDSEAPGWYVDKPTVTLSEFSGWPTIHQWASRLFRIPDHPAPSVRALADDIRARTQTPEQRLTAALSFVQQDIRYVGIELGAGSHQPSEPSQTLKRRFGDCKDKTLLLNTLLQQLDIPANAVLVNTSLRQTIVDEPASPLLFDHVITRAQLNGRSYWLDATDTHQRGALEFRTPAVFGAGLILGDGPDTPQVIRPVIPDSAFPSQTVTQRVLLPEDASQAGELIIMTEFRGSEASYIRGRIARSGEQFHSDYLDYYESLYPGVKTYSPATYHDYPEENRMVIEEHYEVPSLWEKDEDASRRVAWLDGDQLSNFLSAPATRHRTAPYALFDPIRLRQDIKVDLGSQWMLPEEHQRVDSDYFDYQRDVTYTGGVLTVSHRFRSQADHVPATDTEAFMADLQQVNDLRYYGLQETLDGPGPDAPISPYGIGVIVVSLVLLLLVISVVDYLRDRRHEKTLDGGAYYPVSVPKLILLNIMSLGLYSLFWGYRNWAYIRDRDQRPLWAPVRAFFLGFTLYGLYADARRQTLPEASLRWPTAALAVPAVAYFVLGTLTSSSVIWVCYGALILASLCLLPLQRFYNQLNGDNDRFRFNSRWRVRHGILALFFAVIFAFELGTTLYLVPPSHVMAGDKVPTKVRLFLDREHLLTPRETLIQFYASGFLDYTAEGNGLTSQGVFAYWHDTASRLQTEKVGFDEIADLKVTPGSLNSPTLVQITRTDGSYFTLLLSTEDKGDQRFSDALKSRWQARDQTSL